MNNSLLSKILGKLLVAIFIFALVDLAFINWWIVKESKVRNAESKVQTELSNEQVSETTDEVNKSLFPTPTPSAESKQANKETIVETKTIVEKQTQTIVQTAQKEIFVPLGSGSVKSSTFADINGAEVSIDPAKYLNIDYIVFEASIWVDGANGKAWAQIKNVNDNNPIIESQIFSTSGSPEGKTSAKIPYASGAKTYRVQAKSDISNFAANINNARLKIVLK